MTTVGTLDIALVATLMVARLLRMRITVWLLQGFFAVAMIAIVLIFQEDLRYVFERIARWSLQCPS